MDPEMLEVLKAARAQRPLDRRTKVEALRQAADDLEKSSGGIDAVDALDGDKPDPSKDPDPVATTEWKVANETEPVAPPALVPAAFVGTDHSSLVQEVLTSARSVTLTPGPYAFTKAVRVKESNRVIGQGQASVITQYPEVPGGLDDFAFIVEQNASGGGGYFVLLRDLFLNKGGLRINRLGPSVLVDTVWINEARVGLFINALGERARFANFDMRNCIENGLAVISKGSYGFVASNMHISGSGGPGVYLGTDPTVAHSYLTNANLRDCTIQGNQRRPLAGQAACELHIRGLIMDTALQNVHIEGTTPPDGVPDSCMVFMEGTANGTHFDEACRIHDKVPGRPAFIIGRTVGRVTFKGTITNQGNPYGIGSVRLIGGKPERWIYEGPPEKRPTVELV